MEPTNSIDRGNKQDNQLLPTRKCAIYLITNTFNGKCYVGKSIDPKRRWQGHKGYARRGDPRRLYCSIRKHGETCFKFEVLTWFDDEQQAYLEEAKLILERGLCDPNCGYNLTSGGRGGCSMSEATKIRMSESQKLKPGFKGRHHTNETKQLLSRIGMGELNPNFGKHKSDETKKKMSEAQIGRKFTNEHREKLRQAKLSSKNPRRERSEETRQRMREAWIIRKQKNIKTDLD